MFCSNFWEFVSPLNWLPSKKETLPSLERQNLCNSSCIGSHQIAYLNKFCWLVRAHVVCKLLVYVEMANWWKNHRLKNQHTFPSLCQAKQKKTLKIFEQYDVKWIDVQQTLWCILETVLPKLDLKMDLCFIYRNAMLQVVMLFTNMQAF